LSSRRPIPCASYQCSSCQSDVSTAKAHGRDSLELPPSSGAEQYRDGHSPADYRGNPPCPERPRPVRHGLVRRLGGVARRLPRRACPATSSRTRSATRSPASPRPQTHPWPSPTRLLLSSRWLRLPHRISRTPPGTRSPSRGADELLRRRHRQRVLAGSVRRSLGPTRMEGISWLTRLRSVPIAQRRSASRP
jgi:hypothetical protein